jgi:hypothetical protein
MAIVSFVLGILAIFGMLVGLVPFLGWINWGVIPFSVVGVILGALASANERKNKGLAVAGLILCVLAMIVGMVRLFIGCGIY